MIPHLFMCSVFKLVKNQYQDVPKVAGLSHWIVGSAKTFSSYCILKVERVNRRVSSAKQGNH